MNHVIMDILASNAFGGIVGIVTGVLLIVFRKRIARKSVREQNACWALIGFWLAMQQHIRHQRIEDQRAAIDRATEEQRAVQASIRKDS
jgi:hypothetical protein